MRIDILTLFPSMFSPLEESIIGKARKKGLLDINLVDIRAFAADKHRTADDPPYGGGAGMVMKPELIFDAVNSIKRTKGTSKVLLMTPAGKKLDHKMAKELSQCAHLVLICGHYEGIDQRAIDGLVDEEISIGDYVLTGGELPAMVFIDAVSRLIPGVLGDSCSAEDETFAGGMVEYPQYTRPEEHKGKKVPKVLTGGNHKEIAAWRRKQSVIRTFYKRPDLLARAELSPADREALEGIFSGGKE